MWEQRGQLKITIGYGSPLTRGGKSTENLYSSRTIVTLLKYYSIASKSTGVKKYLKYSSQKLLRVLVIF